MTTTALDLKAISFTGVKDEIDKALEVAQSAVAVVERFDFFLPSSIKTAIHDLASILTLIHGIVHKV